jgi:hypothetical protein
VEEAKSFRNVLEGSRRRVSDFRICVSFFLKKICVSFNIEAG